MNVHTTAVGSCTGLLRLQRELSQVQGALQRVSSPLLKIQDKVCMPFLRESYTREEPSDSEETCA